MRGRNRLLRQLFTESLLLALLGATAGLALGFVVLRTLMLMVDAPPWLDPTPDGRVIAFSAGIGFLAAILFGLTPAWQVVRQRHRATFLRHVLIGAQVAASSVLLIVAGLLVRALDRATFADPGFQVSTGGFAIDPNLVDHLGDSAEGVAGIPGRLPEPAAGTAGRGIGDAFFHASATPPQRDCSRQ